MCINALGVIAHGVAVYGFWDLFQFPHSSNLTITCLLNTLISLKDSLPPVMYLQMDNCWRENKNQ